MRLAAPLILAAALPIHAGDFSALGVLAQDEFRGLSKDLGAAFSYKGVAPATALGPLGFDIGIEVTETRIENSALFARAGAGSQSRLVVPKLHLHKGLFAGLDVSAFVAAVPDIDARLLGVAVGYTLVDDGLVAPAIALRASGTKASGLGDLEVRTAALDLMVSKRFTALTPYAGAGMVRVKSSAAGAGLASESSDHGRVFGGVNLNLLFLNMAFEAEKAGDNVSLSAKLGWRF